MRNLSDLGFVFQDYETVNGNVSYPLKDFKQCKAYRHAASCMEIQFLAKLAYDQINYGSIDTKDLE